MGVFSGPVFITRVRKQSSSTFDYCCSTRSKWDEHCVLGGAGAEAERGPGGGAVQGLEALAGPFFFTAFWPLVPHVCEGLVLSGTAIFHSHRWERRSRMTT